MSLCSLLNKRNEKLKRVISCDGLVRLSQKRDTSELLKKKKKLTLMGENIENKFLDDSF